MTGPASTTLLYRLAASYDQDIHYWEPYDAHSRNISPSLLWQPSDRVSVSLKYENFRKLESPQIMQKPGYGRQSGVVPTPSDPNLSGVDVPGLPDTWNSMSDVDYRRSETEGLNAWIDFKADEHWNLRGGYAKQHYSVDALFSGNLGMANNTTFLQGRRLRGQTYTNRGETLSVDAVGQLPLRRREPARAARRAARQAALRQLGRPGAERPGAGQRPDRLAAAAVGPARSVHLEPPRRHPALRAHRERRPTAAPTPPTSRSTPAARWVCSTTGCCCWPAGA